MPSLELDGITLSAFNATLSRYPATVPEKLQELDTLRYDTIPVALAGRNDGDHWLKKDEVEKLVEWKLKHGTFRPKLLQLVQSNTAEVIQSTTYEALNLLTHGLPDAYPPLKALKTLTALKGIGPATASLLLAVAAPDTVPFFSDELFRWCTWDQSGGSGGWKRIIKYNVKEYETLCRRVGELKERLDVRSVDVEKVAWVLGKQGVDVEDEYAEDDDGVVLGEEEEPARAKEEGDAEAVAEQDEQKPKKGTKRKATDAKPATGTRKSTRTKK